MQDRRHTIHWMHLDELRAIYPDANVERRLYVIDRDRFTCAGGTAPLDMMCAIITKHHGADLARAVSNWFIHTAIRKAEEPQQEHQVSMPVFGHPALDVALELIQNHIGDPLTLADLAFLSKISERQLERVAKDRLGMSLMRYYRTIRLKKADDLLSHSNMTIEAIAQATGFSDRSHFSAFSRGPICVVHLHEENLAISQTNNKVNRLRALSIVPKAREYVQRRGCSLFL